MDNRFFTNTYYQNLGIDFIYAKHPNIRPSWEMDLIFKDIVINTPLEDWKIQCEKKEKSRELEKPKILPNLAKV